MRNSLVTATGIAVLAMSMMACGHDAPVSKADPPTDPTSTFAPDPEGRTIANYFKVGDCFADPITGATSVRLVDCATPHSGEVYAIFMLPDGPYPGDNVDTYKHECGAQARAIMNPALVNEPGLRTDIRHPDENTWAQGDRSVTCIASSNPKRTGSIRNAA
jgi:hypothetical protein